jgi:hypothetical protein
MFGGVDLATALLCAVGLRRPMRVLDISGDPPAEGRREAGSMPAPSRLQVDSKPTPGPLQVDSAPAPGPLPARSDFTPSQLEGVWREFCRNHYISVRSHAEQLLRHLQKPDPLWPEGWPGGELRASHVRAAYFDLCDEEGWTPYKWQRVGQEFRKLLGCGRLYRTFYDETGHAHKLAVYPVPALPASLDDEQPVHRSRARTALGPLGHIRRAA